MLVYKVTNRVNGKVYIGKTVRTIEARWKQHIQYALRGNKPPIAIAIRKYGAGAFEVIPLASAKTLQELNELERKYIQDFQSYNLERGYNLTLGGDGAAPGELNAMFGKTHTDEVRQKLRALRLGTKQAEETKRKIGNAVRGEKNGFYGKHHSEETKTTLRELCGSACLGKKHSDETRKKISLAHIGKVKSIEHCQNISKAKTGKPHPPHSQASRLKMSISRKEWWNNRKKEKEL